jgi:hypothetical protein
MQENIPMVLPKGKWIIKMEERYEGKSMDELMQESLKLVDPNILKDIQKEWEHMEQEKAKHPMHSYDYFRDAMKIPFDLADDMGDKTLFYNVIAKRITMDFFMKFMFAFGKYVESKNINVLSIEEELKGKEIFDMNDEEASKHSIKVLCDSIMKEDVVNFERILNSIKVNSIKDLGAR